MSDTAVIPVDTSIGLKPKQKLFCDLLLADPQEIQWLAYAKAYDNQNKRSCESGASRLMKVNVVRAYISEMKAKSAESLGIDRTWVMNRLKDISDRCMMAEPVMEYDHHDKCMKPTGEYVFNAAGANKATELIGKDIGMFSVNPDKSDRLTVNLSINLGNGKGSRMGEQAPVIEAEVVQDALPADSQYAEGRELLEQMGLTKD